MSSVPGPYAWATVLTQSISAAVPAYTRGLRLAASPVTPLDRASANALGLLPLVDAPMVWLSRADGVAVLRLIENAALAPAAAMRHRGWMALEMLVDDLDAMVAALPPGFTVLGPPRALEVSPAIHAAQVLGPSGELYYLTRVDAPVPPFALPQSARDPFALFIAVARCADRSAELAAWRAIGALQSWQFDTRISVLNRELGEPLDRRWPVAVVQLAGNALVEIDAIDRPVAANAANALRAGLWGVAIRAHRAPPQDWRLPSGARIEWLTPPASHDQEDCAVDVGPANVSVRRAY